MIMSWHGGAYSCKQVASATGTHLLFNRGSLLPVMYAGKL